MGRKSPRGGRGGGAKKSILNENLSTRMERKKGGAKSRGAGVSKKTTRGRDNVAEKGNEKDRVVIKQERNIFFS